MRANASGMPSEKRSERNTAPAAAAVTDVLAVVVTVVVAVAAMVRVGAGRPASPPEAV